VRFRPSYFPFVEPGVEVDFTCAFCRGKPAAACARAPAGSRSAAPAWSTPRCSPHVGIDPEVYTGFAFGMGIERMAMLRHNVSDIKLYYEGDLRFLQQF
jgi:phenylalanyl-tRNA synthetase alpha chain